MFFHWFNPILDYLHTLDANRPQKLWSRIFLTNLMYGWFVLFTEHELWLMALGSFQWSFFLGLHSDFTVEQRHRFDSLCCSWQSPPGVPNNSDLNWYDMDLHLFFWLMSVSPCISLFLECFSVLCDFNVFFLDTCEVDLLLYHYFLRLHTQQSFMHRVSTVFKM